MTFETINPETQSEGIAKIPPLPEYTKEQLQNAEAIMDVYEKYGKAPALLQLKLGELSAQAKAHGVKRFREAIADFEKGRRMDGLKTGLTTEGFKCGGAPLLCGEWECSEYGVSRNTMKGKEVACSHPIFPVERLRNIDTGLVQYRLAFVRSKAQKTPQTIVVDSETISTSRSIVKLSNMGVSITSTTASALVDFLAKVRDLNYDVIPETKSISRMGYIPGEGFMPFADGVVFDGDASFRGLYDSINQKGSITEWYDAMTEIRKGSTEARIVLAASFAAPVLSVVGSLPFFVHLWGGTGTGKTVALMAAASVWGNPALGSYVQTFNATGVSQERTAAFLNHLPFCIDELQLTRDSKGKTTFDVYQLAQGVGRSRGRRDGGIDAAPTWRCCFITTGESPIVSGSDGAGAVNRVIDIECSAEKKIVEDGKGLYSKLTQNYGHAGRSFVRQLYESEEVQKQVREIYNDFYHELCKGDSTEKQAMAAAVILTGDCLATHWIFDDDGLELTVNDMRRFMATKESVSVGHRAYTWLRDWVATSKNHFITDQGPASGDIYGALEGNTAYIIRSVFDRVLRENGYSEKAVLSYLREKNLIETHIKGGKPNGYTKTKYIGGTKPQCVCLRLEGADTGDYCEEVDMLPL